LQTYLSDSATIHIPLIRERIDPLINLKDALDESRSHAQELHKSIDAAVAKKEATLRTDLQAAAGKAQTIAQSLKATAKEQGNDAKQHVEAAVSKLEDAAKTGTASAAADDAHLRLTAKKMLDQAQSAVQSLGRAVAAKRASLASPKNGAK
jgi:hypothetical protein